jgi:hypothetical protein
MDPAEAIREQHYCALLNLKNNIEQLTLKRYQQLARTNKPQHKIPSQLHKPQSILAATAM